MEARLADHSRCVRPRLPRHVLADRPCRGRPGRAHPGRPRPPYTAGFACAKVNRDAELVHSPRAHRHAAAPHRPQGRGPVRADHLGRGARRDRRALEGDHRRRSGPLALLGYAYSAHQGQMNRGLVNGLFHALGTSRLQAGTVCDTCCETAWDVTVGPVGGADPESVVHSDLVVSWGADLMATNVHFWAMVEEARKKRGVQIVVIDPRRSRTAQARRLAHPRSASAPTPRWRSASCTSWCATSSCDRDYHRQPHARLRPGRARDPAALHAGARGRDHRPRRRRHRDASRRCTARPRPPSSASARA